MANISKIRLSGTTYTIYDESAIHSLDGYSTTEQMNQAITAATGALAETIAEADYQNASQVQNAITAATANKADTTAVTAVSNALTVHTANTDVHVTVDDKNAWNAKLDTSDVAGLFGNVKYDSATKRINFYHTKDASDTTVLAFIDASDFIKDGMVNNVEVKAVEGVTSLVITFNTDAGHSDIVIPISQIFDASNYYTKTEVDNAITAATNGLASEAYVSGYTYDKDTINKKISDSGTFDPTQYYTKTDIDGKLTDKADTATTYTKTEVDTALGGKQATLVSGTNIKTVGTQSVLGSGNIALMTAHIGTGEDSTTLIFDFA